MFEAGLFGKFRLNNLQQLLLLENELTELPSFGELPRYLLENFSFSSSYT